MPSYIPQHWRNGRKKGTGRWENFTLDHVAMRFATHVEAERYARHRAQSEIQVIEWNGPPLAVWDHDVKQLTWLPAPDDDENNSTKPSSPLDTSTSPS